MTEQSKILRSLPRSVPGAAPGQGENKTLFHGNGVRLKSQRGGFLEICSTKIVKSDVFHGQETLFEEHSLPVSFFHGPEANKSGGHKLEIGNHKFYQGKDDILVGQGARNP